MWVRLSDDFYICNKVKFVRRDARDLFIAMVSWCNRALTDGYVPEHQLELLAAEAEIKPTTKKYIKELIERLLTTAPREKYPMLHPAEGGYLIHDYLDYQLSKKEVLAHREHIKQIRSENGSKGADARWGPVGPDGKRSKPDSKGDGKNGKTDGKNIAPFPESRIREDSTSDSGVVYVSSSSAREGTTKTGLGGSNNSLWDRQKKEFVDLIEVITGDLGSRNAFGQLYDACFDNDVMDIWAKAQNELLAHIRKGSLRKTPGAYFYGRVKSLLGKKQIFLSEKISEQERTEIDSALDEFRKLGDSGDAPEGDERPP